MKRTIIFLYVIGVLIASSVARAEGQMANLPISNVLYNDGSWQVAVQGPLSNPCITSPKATLEINKSRKLTFNLRVIGVQSGDFCAQVIRENYKVEADLRDLVAKTGIRIIPGATYTVISDSASFEVQFKGSDLLSSASDQVRVSGTLFAQQDGQLAIMTSDQTVVLVDSEKVQDGQLYINKNVSVEGKVGPLQTSDERYVSPSRNQQIQPVVRLMVVKIQPLEK